MNFRAMRPCHPPRRPTGFTLVEMLTTLALLGMLAAVAYPSYATHLHRAHRADARAALMDAAFFMQRHYAAHHRYDTGDASAPLVSLPAPLNQSPRQGPAHYAISVTQADAGSYTLSATPVTTGPMAHDPCGSLTLNQHHTRGITGTTVNVAQCWR
ncbi:MAG: type IV pilin protein [Aquabacterium sp.]|jgi:type IV pilus assembly protein PilE|uniref:type IV pilin protein n=1 Tax=Aquabacterium sp. TaxID=1872578 RepID=UPI002A359F2B|nr:type IV pilin protein [Aquabacterium sp.]MDX9842860.1 type IV pilin protein [Aquabacterium sp.]